MINLKDILSAADPKQASPLDEIINNFNSEAIERQPDANALIEAILQTFANVTQTTRNYH